ncbi:fusolin precursor [Tieghemostelium lacteum]|uniref:Fusolin n=1 Tax=Tieghemostelium lacteum TaxID=361077 RepID=A0A151Z4X1_TIELA|nr:fusolin precursor [Tieghemostelium lacteum]|eukprot:KYQ89019.1 fusolin precursor [Tieghemostelium lacteum]
MLKLVLVATILSLTIIQVSGHGYLTYPISRQIRCTSNNQNSIWWPENGDGIKDPQCKAAFQYVYNKYGGSADAARYQFVQKNEYSINIPDYAQGPSAMKARLPKSICSAGAVNKDVLFGDKSGMSIPYPWPATIIDGAGAGSKTINISFCATAVHAPNQWSFYVTKPGFNVATQEITWDNLELIQNYPTTQVPSTPTNNLCETSNAYNMAVTLPARYTNAVLVSVWQRVDPVGECFINCADYVFSGSNPTTSSTSSKPTTSSTTAAATTVSSTTGRPTNTTTSSTSSTTGTCMCPCACSA